MKKGRDFVEYRIEYAGGECGNTANGRNDVIEWLKILKDETISDIRKVYKDGRSCSVVAQYERYIRH